jgi:DNA-binding LacI/PurR family transcriptional regulator
MVTVGIKEVAQRAGVSPGTVSNVLNRPERVAAATRERVEQAIRELGFVRNGSASTLRAGQSRAVGLVVLDVGNPFFAEVARGVEDVVSARDHAVILCNSGESPEKEARNLRVLAEQRVRGVLITPAGEDISGLRRLRDRGVAVVFVDHSASGDVCSVSVDDMAGGELAARHLIANGAKRIAFVSGPHAIRQCSDRRQGALRALNPPEQELVDVVVPEMNAHGGRLAAEMLLEGGLPDAVFCANDLLALGVLRALLQAGVRVPEDVALIGYDDIEFSSAAAVPLSSIRQPTYQLGKIATELLLDECDTPEEHVHQQIMFQPELVVRESSR